MLKHHYMIKLTSRRFSIIDSTDYCPFACEFSIWNASIATLQLWTEDLDPQTLSSAIEIVYTAFFYSDSDQHLQNVEEVLFGHFMTTLNDAFEQALTSEGIKYKSWSESMNISIPLH